MLPCYDCFSFVVLYDMAVVLKLNLWCVLLLSSGPCYKALLGWFRYSKSQANPEQKKEAKKVLRETSLFPLLPGRGRRCGSSNGFC